MNDRITIEGRDGAFSTGRVAVLGYCLGALMVFLTAVRYGVDAAVAYHGGDTEKYLFSSLIQGTIARKELPDDKENQDGALQPDLL